jgi:predicted transposase/invertase (TIGR01784 family)
MSEYKYEVDTQSKVVHARREGMQKGRQKGRQEGMQKRSVEIAHNSKKLGIPVEQIALITGLSPDEIAKL